MELARLDPRLVGVRDSKLADSPVLAFDLAGLRSFVQAARSGAFDL